MYWLLFSLLLCVVVGAREKESLEPALFDIDLYKALGVPSDASSATIRKKYRELARIHHPDKAQSPSQKELNAQIFRDIAQAHEVLSNAEHRQEYDRERAARHAQGEQRQYRHHQQQYQHQHQQRQQDQHYQHQQQQHAFYDDDFYGGYEEEDTSYFYEAGPQTHPIVVGSIMRSGQFLLPYNPILTSPDGTHFAFLDGHCSLGVFRGDLDHVLRHMYSHGTLDLTELPVELMYRTPGKPELQGRCFAALDDEGVLRIFRGQHDSFSGTVWESTPPKQQEFSYFTTFFLELTSSGELAVLSLRTGNTEPECVWSSTACNLYLSLLQELRVETIRILQGVRKIISSCFRAVVALINDVLLDEKPLKLLRTRALAVARHLKGIVTDFFVL